MKIERMLPLLCLMLGVSAARAAPAQDRPFDLATRVAVDIPIQPLESALLELSKQAAFQLVISAGSVPDRKIAPLSGTMPIREALDRLLRGTELGYRWVGEHTVTVAPRRATSSADEAADRSARIRLTQVKEEARDQTAPAGNSGNKQRGGEDQEGSEVIVTGSRIRVMLGEATPNAVITYTREQLDELGIQSVQDLARYIPQLGMEGNADPETAGNFGAQFRGVSTVFSDLRGLGSTYSLVLVDGRRLPRAQQYNGFDTQDLNGIPMSAVERVEILPAGASAIYGTNAVTGVINFILRKNYDTTEFSVSHRNTWDTDTGISNARLSHGFSRGAFSFGANLEWSETHSLAPRDRWWTASADRRAYGGTDTRSIVPGGRGSVRTTNGANLPGLTTPNAAIPAGSDGVNLTIADFANAGPIAPRLDQLRYVDNASISNQGINLRAEYELRPWMKLFSSGRWGEKTALRPGNYTLPVIGTGTTAVQRVESSGAITLPANFRGNPFGVPIVLEKVFWDLIPYLTAEETSSNPNLEIGSRGDLPGKWAYEIYVRKSWVEQDLFGSLVYSANGVARFNAAINNADPALRPILLHDSLSLSPNSAAVMRNFFEHRPISNRTTTWEYSARADGPVWSLPSGEVRMAFSTVRHKFGAETQYSPNDLSYLTQVSSAISGRSDDFAAQLQLPLVGKDFRFPLVRDLRLNMTVGRTRQDVPKGESTVADVGVIWKPLDWLTLRANRNESYKLPTLYEALQPNRTISTIISTSLIPALDPLRGNTPVNYVISAISGGYPDLKPQDGRTESASIEVGLPAVPGLKLAVLYSDTDIINQIVFGSLNYPAIFNFMPERVTRATLTAADQARGYTGGLVTQIDARNLNLARFRTANLDINIDYTRTFGEWGRVNLSLRGTRPLKNDEVAVPGAPPTDFGANRYSRHTAVLSWYRGPWGLGSAVRYSGQAMSGSLYIPSYTQTDAWIDYDFQYSGHRFTGWRQHLLEGLKVSLRGIDVMPKDPQFQVANGLIAGRGNSYQGQYQLELRKTF